MIEIEYNTTLEEIKKLNGKTLVFPTLYKKSYKGKTTEWTIYLDLTKELPEYYTVHGQIDGKLQQTTPTIVEPGIVKKDVIEIAVTRVKREYQDQIIEQGKTPDLDFSSSDLIRGSPMLAQQFYNDKKNKFVKINYPVYVQRKFDGVRCLVSLYGKDLIFRSRQNKPFTFMSSFNYDIKRLLTFLPPGTELDGELYIHGKSLQEITSIVRRSVNPKEEMEEVVYQVFDIVMENLPYEERYELLMNAWQNLLETTEINKICMVESILVKNFDALVEMKDLFLEEGYEGIIIRKIHRYKNKIINPLEDTVYVHARRNNLLKWTPWLSAEGEIVNIFEGKGNNKGLAIFSVTNIFYDSKIKDSKKIFNISLKTTHDRRKEIFENKDEYVGKELTYQYKHLSKANVPSKAIGIEIRDYE